ncbi:DUF2971 domain-containing protein [Methanococcus maripaludis]|uniref:DUF2971 domain-containing protein n=1 Tax=Methanococcus maripaludis TaxID=39152 RepID=A0A7J9RZZ2_METMI|nr:DUF2971 domain-containing protein [Methanococcus maripaludis]MBB6067563.1 hypothetical protein [Methanococcus maripaludis]
MNDPEEGKTLLKFLQENKIKGISRDYPLSTFYEDIDGIDIQTTFVGSFLRDEDKLYLWRTYGKDSGKEDAKGMCIVVDSEYFEKRPYNNFDSLKSIDIKNPDSICEMRRSIGGIPKKRKFDKIENSNQKFMPVIYDVIYTNKKGLTEIKKFLKKIKPHLENLEEIALKNNGRYSGLISAVVRSIMDEVLYLIKSDNYEEENESRILVTCGINNSKIKYNEDTGFPYRLYIEIEKPFKEYIEKIVLGPKVDDCARWKLYLNREGIKVKESKCNYR